MHAKLQVVKGEDVCTAVVEQTRVVTDDDGSDVGQRVKVGFHPRDVNDVCEKMDKQ